MLDKTELIRPRWFRRRTERSRPIVSRFNDACKIIYRAYIVNCVFRSWWKLLFTRRSIESSNRYLAVAACCRLTSDRYKLQSIQIKSTTKSDLFANWKTGYLQIGEYRYAQSCLVAIFPRPFPACGAGLYCSIHRECKVRRGRSHARRLSLSLLCGAPLEKKRRKKTLPEATLRSLYSVASRIRQRAPDTERILSARNNRIDRFAVFFFHFSLLFLFPSPV